MLFLGYCKLVATYNNGRKKYELAGCRKLALYVDETAGRIKIEGSLPYYYQGHNFCFSRDNLALSIRDIETLLNIDITSAEIDCIEYGTIIEVERKPIEYIKHHHPAVCKPNKKLIAKPSEKAAIWEDGKSGALKMYDAGYNIKCKQNRIMQRLIKEEGWNPKSNYLKWEVHNNRPASLLGGKVLWLADLFREEVQMAMKEDLLFQYQRLKPMRSIETPLNKKDLKADTIALSYAVEVGLNNGKSVEEIKSELYDKINALPLSAKDKDNRKARIKKLLSRLKEASISEWDLYEKIRASIEDTTY